MWNTAVEHSCLFHLFAIYIELDRIGIRMCGRYSLFPAREDLEDRFGVNVETSFQPRYNAAPGQQLPVITDTAQDSVRHLKWGLVPRWAETATESHINARSETAAEKPAFADAYEQRRCLVPADGFYEWTGSGDQKQPYRVTFDDGRLFAMAGLWERWTPKTKQTGLGDFTGDRASDGTSDTLETFTILTTEPNEVVEQLHHRMAVILRPDEEAAWLDGERVSFDPAPAERLRSYPVSTAVNNPANDSPTVVEAIDE